MAKLMLGELLVGAGLVTEADVLTALREQHGLVPSSPPITTRLAQGSLALLAGTSVL